MDSKEFKIRRATMVDILALQKMAKATFYESFIDITPEADMQEYLEAAFSTEALLAELQDQDSIFYFIENGVQLMGYGKINFNKVPYGFSEMPNSMEIQRIYIKKEFQQCGAAGKLMHVFFEEARKRKLHNIWLSTGSLNNKALSFYSKYGFETIGHHEFPVGGEMFDDLILLLNKSQ
ncbi:MAG: GNAT family N-acetyltransferase [Bacteroidetes bacterium]|nr:GNAT family N-acetyltransferase [Bacteroidota bacterium]